MRVISLHQPWASLLVTGEKIFETRHWPTEYRGDLAIHAAKTTQWKSIVTDSPFRGALSKHGYEKFDDLPRGGIIGKVRLDAMFGTDSHFVRTKLIELKNERFFGNFELGRYAWFNRNPVKFDKMVECVGRQGFFNIDDDLIKNAILF